MASTTEIRPGSVDERDLGSVARALAADGTGARLVDGHGHPVSVPDELLEVLATIVKHLQAGDGVSVAPLHAELSTFEAADLLNVSRPHLIKVLESGAMPFRLVGTHRRVRLIDVLAYRDHQAERSEKALSELTRQAEDLGLYE